jgi:hypothetical protein
MSSIKKFASKFKTYARFLLALFLVPTVVALVWEFFYLATGLAREISMNAVPFWLGIGSYFLFQFFFSRPIRTYVFGHELTHALVGLMSGARLKSFKVSAAGGSVVLTKTSLLIALSPYFVPIYTVLLILLYWLGAQFFDIGRFHAYFLYAAGFTLSFHFGLTYFALAQGQSDLKEFGTLFSGVIIALINCCLLASLLKLLFPEQISLQTYFVQGFDRNIEIWQWIFQQAKSLCSSFRQMK